MKHFRAILSLLILALLLVASSSYPGTVRAECYQFVGGGDAIVVPCPDNDSGDDDSDGDGISNRSDNCPSVSNADQLDTWGGGAGNACEETSIGQGSGGALAFPQHDGTYDIYGDCYTDAFGEIQCHLMARLAVCELPATIGTSVYATNPSVAAGSTQQTLVTLMEINGAQRVYQINIQDAQGVNLGSAFNITYENVDCPEAAPPPLPPPVVTDIDDYCPNAAGRVGGCPDLASYFAALNALGIDYRSIWVTLNGTLPDNTRPLRTVDMEMLTSRQFYITREFCEASYYQFIGCRLDATQPDSHFERLEQSCQGYYQLTLCLVTWDTYCAFVDDATVCGYTSFGEYCQANSLSPKCSTLNSCVQNGYDPAVCPYLQHGTFCTSDYSEGTLVSRTCTDTFGVGLTSASQVPPDVRPSYCQTLNNAPPGCPITTAQPEDDAPSGGDTCVILAGFRRCEESQ